MTGEKGSGPEHLLASSRAAGVELWVEGRRLRFRAPEGGLPPELADRIRSSRGELIEYLMRKAEATREVAPLAPSQEGLWLLWRLSPESAAYNTAFALRIRGALDLSALEEAVQALSDRHESLRTIYPLEDGVPVRVIQGRVPLPVETVDMEGRTDPEVHEAVLVAFHRPFDLSGGPVARAVLFRKGPEDAVLLVVVHHISSDGTSQEILLEELVALYDANTRGGALPTREGVASFSEFAAWQERRLEAAEDDLRYWRTVLTPRPPRLVLPLDRPQSESEALSGRTYWAAMEETTARALAEFARLRGTTEFTVLLTLWMVFLRRMTGETDIAVGVPSAGRSARRFTRTVGNLVSMLPIRIRDVGATGFAALLNQVRSVVLEGMARQDVPLARMVQGLDVAPGEGGGLPFQVSFAFQDLPGGGLALDTPRGGDPGVRAGAGMVTRYPIDRIEPQMDLSLDVWPKEGKLYCCWRYNGTVLDEETVVRWAACLGELAAAALRDPDLLVDELPLLSPEDRELLEGWNRTERSWGGNYGLVEAVADQAAASPDRMAVSSHDGSYSYAELVGRARGIAGALVLAGVGAGDRVGVLVPRGRDLVPALLGVLWTGAAYVPLDASHPPSRLSYMLRTAGTSCLLLGGAAPEALDWSLTTVRLDDVGGLGGDAPPPVPAAREDLAYVIFTSGSTGLPKGVAVTRGSLMNLLRSMAEEPGMGPGDVLLAVTTVAFDISGLELYLPLLVGGRVHVAQEEDARDAEALTRLLDEVGATVLQATPATWKLLVSSGWEGSSRLRAFSGAEALPGWLAAELQSRVSEVWNLYGPTETTIWSTAGRIEVGGGVHVGRPIANTTLHVLDPRGQPVPVGVPGELWIGGAGVAREYIGRPDLTGERFRPSPFRPGERLYRTGDLVRFRPDGLLLHLGRLDHQVKVRGYRIEPEEIETQLRQHEDVVDAVVVARDEALAAYIVLREGADGLPDLREWLAASLPPYMIPSGFLALPELPLNSNGKVDRRALPALGDAPGPDGGLSLGAGGEEEVLLDIWRAVLGRETVGIHDDFFHLGGHSLNATQVVARTRDLLDVEVPLRTFFDRPTIHDLAEWIRSARGDHVRLPPLTRREPLPDPVPLSSSQERMWFLNQLDPGSAAYNMIAAIRILGQLDRGRLRASFQQVARRQESMRTRFPLQRGVASPEVASEDIVWLEEEVRAGAPEAALALARERAVELLEEPYDLETGPLTRVYLARIGQDDHVLAVGMHHIVSDMWSFAVLGREVAAAYQGTPLEPGAVRYRDYAAWQREWLRATEGSQQVAYWVEHLKGVRPLELPVDYPRPAFFPPLGATLDVPLGQELRVAVERFSARHRATPFMTLLAAFNVVLSARSGQEDVPIGVPIANRTRTATEELVGTFVNTLVHRNDLSGDPTFREFLSRVRSVALGAFGHQDAPFEAVVQAVQPPRDPSRPPLVQVLFNVANVPTEGALLPGVTSSLQYLPRRAAQFELSLEIGLNALQSHVGLNYSTALFDRETAERILQQYLEVLERATADPDLRLSELRRPPEAERLLLLEEWNDTAREWPEDSLPARVAQTSRRTPDRTAVTASNGSLSYGELQRYAGSLTAELRARGIGRGDRVAVLLGRGRELPAVLLGILGSGAAYVPVDPTYPEDRVSFMLGDSGAALLVTHRGLERPFDVRVPVLDLDLWSPPPPEPPVELRSDDPAYVIYTSGSTGRPKGVEIRHGSVTNFLRSMGEEPGLAPEDVLLAVTTISFDIAVLELYLPLVTGARLVLADEDQVVDGRRLARLMDEEEVTVLQATPATWKLLLSAGWRGREGFRALCGGEALPAALAEELLGRVDELWNMYGPTETTVWSTVHRVRPGEPIVVGRPIANTTLYVLDEARELRPIGVPGELYIGGDGVAAGYVNRPDLTAERFIDNPFREGERLYRTGDRVRLRHDGVLEHLGRLDDQVKVRGFRVELGEVESALRRHPAVRDAAAVVRDDRLLAYIVPDPEAPATSSELRAAVGEVLPPYMVPSLITELDALPLTPNGKVDRKSLPDPTSRAGAAPTGGSATGGLAPEDELRDPAERVLGEIWAELLGVPGVGAGDNFFEVGGSSLMAMQVVARFEERTGHRIEPRLLFFRSLREIASGLPVETPAP